MLMLQAPTNTRFVGYSLAALALAVLAQHLVGLNGAFLCDDFSHLDVIARNSERGRLGPWVLERFFRGLDNGNFAYRPIVFASYALDWVVYRAHATGWHATNLALYFIDALAAGLLVRRWLRSDPAVAGLGAAMAVAAMVAFPFAGEISFWPVGRFDLLAALFSLLYLHALPPASVSTLTSHAWRVVCLLCALLSKESAMPLPLVASLVCASVAPGGAIGVRIRAAARETAPTWTAFALYLVWRKALFGSYWKVYPGSLPPRGFGELIDRIWAVRHVVSANVGDYAVLWTIAALAFLVVSAAPALRRRNAMPNGLRMLAVALLASAALYAVAPASGFPMAGSTGDGGRHLYLAWVYASLGLALVCARAAPAQWALVGLLGVMFYAEAQSLGKWQAAAREMRRITGHVAAFAEGIPAHGYALLLLPDHIGPALFARNAQGGIVSRPTQPADYLDRMAVMTEEGFEVWSEELKRITREKPEGMAHGDPMDAVGLFCWNPSSSAIVPLTGGAIARDPARWRREAQQRLGPAGCLAAQ